MNKTIRNLVMCGIAVVAVLLLTIIIVNLDSTDSNKVRIGHLGISPDIATYIAVENGYYAEQGLQVELLKLETSNQLADSLIAGHIDVASILSSPSVFAVEQNQPGTFRAIGVFLTSKKYPFLYILARMNDSSINSIADLKGKKIGLFPGTTTQAQLRYALKQNGMDPGDVEMISLAPNLHLAALSSGSVDALFSLEPIPTIGELKGITKKIDILENYLPDPGYNALTLVTKEYAAKNPEIVKRLQKANDKAIDYIRKYPSKAKLILTKYTSLTPDIAAETGIGYHLKSTEKKDISKAQEYADLLYREGELKRDVDVSSLFN
jgi:NitT/TauT family transport system substrate-binding protein